MDRKDRPGNHQNVYTAPWTTQREPHRLELYSVLVFLVETYTALSAIVSEPCDNVVYNERTARNCRQYVKLLLKSVIKQKNSYQNCKDKIKHSISVFDKKNYEPCSFVIQRIHCFPPIVAVKRLNLCMLPTVAALNHFEPKTHWYCATQVNQTNKQKTDRKRLKTNYDILNEELKYYMWCA